MRAGPREAARAGAGGLWPFLALAALAAGLYPGAVFLGQAFYERDVHLVWHAQVEAFVRSIAAGSWPVWNPFLSFGQPLLANPHTQVLYPFTWLNLLLPPWTVYTLFVVAHTAFAGAGLYLLARRLGISGSGALVAAACWMASGPFVSLANMWIQLGGASFIPWVFLAASHALTSRRPRQAVLWGGTVALQLLAGSPDMSLLTVGAVAAWTLWRVRPRAGAGPAEVRIAGVAVAAGLFAAALSAGLWLPAIDMTRHAARWGLDSAERTVWSVDPIGLAEIFSPLPLTDLPIDAGLRRRLYDGGAPLVRSLYLGVPALALVAAAFCGMASRARTFALLVLAAATVFALGRHTPLYEVAVALVPPLRVLRFPSKAMAMVAFAWALLAGLGLDAWRAKGVASRKRWAAAVLLPVVSLAALMAVAGALCLWRPAVFAPWLLPEAAPSSSGRGALGSGAWRLLLTAALATAAAAAAWLRVARPARASALAPLAGALAVLDLALAGARVNPTVPVAFYKVRPPILDTVRQEDLSRLYVYRYPFLPAAGDWPGTLDPYRTAVYPPGLTFDAGRTLAARLYVTPPVGGCWDLFGSYEPDLIGLYPRHVAELVGWMEETEGTPAYARYLRLGAVRHVSALQRHAGMEELEALAVYPSLLARPILLLGVKGAVPRTYAVGTARGAEGDDARRLLLDPRFDPATEVVLAGGGLRGDPSFSGHSRVVGFTPDRVRMEVDLSAPGIVVLVDAYDPGWKATVDGQPAPLLRANVAFRGVQVPAGRHVVEQVYRPWTVLAGLATSAAALVAGAFVVLRRRP